MENKKQIRFLLIGSEGYIGKVLQKEIVKAGHKFTGIDNNTYGLVKKYGFVDEQENNEILYGNTLHPDKIDFLRGKDDYDVLVNLAAIVGDPACLIDTRFALKNNCVGTRNMVEKANRDGKKIIHISTCSLYGSESCTLDNPLTEEDKVFPIDFYGQTKYQQERFVTESANDFCVFRLGTATGKSPRMRYDLVIPTFTAKAVREGEIEVFGGNQYRPIVNITDVSRAVIFTAENNLNGVYNLANENVTIKEIADKIKKILPDTKVIVNDMIQDPRNYIVSNKKLLTTGFKFEWDINRGIIDMINSNSIQEYDRVIYSNYQLMQLKKSGIKL